MLNQILSEIMVPSVFLYVVSGAVLIDRNGSTWIVVALPVCGAVVAPAIAFIVSLLTNTVFAFSLPGLILPMVVVGVISLLLCYGYSSDLSAPIKELPFE